MGPSIVRDGSVCESNTAAHPPSVLLLRGPRPLEVSPHPQLACDVIELHRVLLPPANDGQVPRAGWCGCVTCVPGDFRCVAMRELGQI